MTEQKDKKKKAAWIWDILGLQTNSGPFYSWIHLHERVGEKDFYLVVYTTVIFHFVNSS